MVQRALRRRLCWIWQPVAITLFVACSSGWAQTTQEAQTEKTPETIEYDYKTLLQQVAKRPLVQAQLRRPDDKALSEAEQKEIAKSTKLMADAKASRAKGDFVAAQQQSREAQVIRGKILGPKNYLTISSRVLADSMKRWSQVSDKESRRKLIKSDELLAKVEGLQDQGEYSAAIDAATTAASLRKEVVPEDGAEIGKALRMLGSVQIDLGQLDRANETLMKAGGLISAAYGERHPQSARVMDRIGWLRVSQARRDRTDKEKVDDALQALRSAVSIFVHTLGEGVEAAESLDNLGTAMVVNGEARKALGVKIRALFVRRQVLGPNARDTGVSLANLAWLYERMKKDDQAMILREEAEAVFEKALGPDHPYTMIQKDSLAELYHAKGEDGKALKLLEELVSLDEKRSDKLAPGVGSRLVRLAGAYLRAGRPDDALKLLERGYQHALAMRKDGQVQPAAQILSRIAQLCGRYRMFDAQLKYQEEVVKWDDAKRGQKDDLIMANRASKLGGLYFYLGRLDDAERKLTEVVERLRKLRGDNNAFLAPPLLNLARIYLKRGDLSKAESNCEKVLRISEAKLSRKALGTAYTSMEMGNIYAAEGIPEMAKFSLDEAREVFSLYADRDPDGNIKIRQAMARYHLKKKEPGKALELLRDALQRCRDWPAKLSPAHRRAATAATLKALLDTADPKDATLEKDRQAWKAELKTLLETIKKNHALSAKEKTWLTELDG